MTRTTNVKVFVPALPVTCQQPGLGKTSRRGEIITTGDAALPDPTPSTTLPTLAQRSDVLVAFSQFWEEQCERDSSRQELLSS